MVLGARCGPGGGFGRLFHAKWRDLAVLATRFCPSSSSDKLDFHEDLANLSSHPNVATVIGVVEQCSFSYLLVAGIHR